VLIATFFLCCSFSINVSALNNVDDTYIDIVLISENNVTGFINGTSVNGSVYYYIDGIEVKGEFNNIWDTIMSTRKIAVDARSSAGNAYFYADSAFRLARDTNNTVVSLSYIVDNNTYKIFMLRDELVSFENDYIIFKDDTMNYIALFEHNIGENKKQINSLSTDLSLLQSRYEELKIIVFSIIGILFLFIFCFFVLIWIFNKQKKYIDNRDKKILLYIDKQLFLSKQIYEMEEKKDV